MTVLELRLIAACLFLLACLAAVAGNMDALDEFAAPSDDRLWWAEDGL